MLCIPIVGPNPENVEKQIQEASQIGDLLEWRLDFFYFSEIKILEKLRGSLERPVIFTLHKKEEESEESYLKKILALAALEPDYLDLDVHLSRASIETVAACFPKIKRIISTHCFTETPSDLEGLLFSMKQHSGNLYKMACHARSINDSLRMLAFLRQHTHLLGMCMGEKGRITRILGPQFGCPWVYASLNEEQKSAPGQIPAAELKEIYGIEASNPKRQIYGLIGTVNKSLSHKTHNHAMKAFDLNGIYIKMEVETEELETFFSLAKTIGIKGLSVTMPLKEKVIPYLDIIDEKAKTIGAVNTIAFVGDRLHGYNTDAAGALDALEEKIQVKGKKIAILGAGGAARALIYEARARGADVKLLNRTLEKAKNLAQEFGVSWTPLDARFGYDILINTTPDSCPIGVDQILPNTVVMDIKTVPKKSALLDAAETKNCSLVYGYEMFVNQAAEQFDLWFSQRIKKEALKKVLKKETLKMLV